MNSAHCVMVKRSNLAVLATIDQAAAVLMMEVCFNRHIDQNRGEMTMEDYYAWEGARPLMLQTSSFMVRSQLYNRPQTRCCCCCCSHWLLLFFPLFIAYLIITEICRRPYLLVGMDALNFLLVMLACCKRRDDVCCCLMQLHQQRVRQDRRTLGPIMERRCQANFVTFEYLTKYSPLSSQWEKVAIFGSLQNGQCTFSQFLLSHCAVVFYLRSQAPKGWSAASAKFHLLLPTSLG